MKKVIRAAAVAWWTLSAAVSAAPTGVDLSRYLFVALRDRHDVAIVDIDLQSKVGSLDAGLTPDFVAVSLRINKLIVANRQRVNLIDPVSRSRTEMQRDVTAEPLLLSASAAPNTAVDVQSFQDAAYSRGDRSLQAIYPAWFNTVAFAAIQGSPRLLVYDLDSRKLQSAIILPGPPGHGLVTGDGAWLILTLPESGAIEVIDARLRRARGSIEVGGKPIALAMAGSFGLCH